MEDMERKISYSQNFLRSPELVCRLLADTNIDKEDTVFEIGPGRGIITEELAKICRRIIAIELDPNLYRKLHEKHGNNQKIEIIRDDFLKYNLPEKGDCKIFSNIPFDMTADIIKKITESRNPPADSYLIVQREAALKYAGRPYYKESQSSLLLKTNFDIRIIRELKRSDFQPQPQVDTVLLQIERRKKPVFEIQQEKIFRDFVVFGFSKWQPTLKKAFNKIFTNLQFKRLAKDLGFDKMATPTDLNFEQWQGLFRYFLSGVIKEKKSLVAGSEEKLKKEQSRLQKIHRTSFTRNK